MLQKDEIYNNKTFKYLYPCLIELGRSFTNRLINSSWFILYHDVISIFKPSDIEAKLYIVTALIIMWGKKNERWNSTDFYIFACR